MSVDRLGRPGRPDPREIAGLVVLLVAYAAMRWPFRDAPLIRDEGEYVHLGQQILRGAIPYLDIYNQKTPLVFYATAALQALGGASVEAFRIATTVWGAATALVLWTLARRLCGSIAAWLATAAWVLLSFDRSTGVYQAAPEFFMLPFLAAGLLAAYGGTGRAGSRRWLLAGVLAALAFQTKQSGLALLAFLVAERALALAKDRHALRDLGSLLAGFIAVTALVAAAFAAVGALGAYVECVWTNNFQYAGSRLGPRSLGRVPAGARWILPWGSGLALLGGAGLMFRATTGRLAGPRHLWLLLATTLGIALAAGGSYPHYFELAFVPLSLGVADAWVALAGRSPRLRLAGLALFVLAWVPALGHGLAAVRDPAGTLAHLYRLAPTATVSPEVADYLAERTEPGEPILVVGSEPQIYFLADRPSSSRMAFMYPMTGPYRYAAPLRSAFLRQLDASGPEYVVWVGLLASQTEFPRIGRKFEAEVGKVLRRRYALEARFPAGMAVYRRCRGAGCAAAPAP